MDPKWFGGPPPGWYPDPAGVKAWRWWDGHGSIAFVFAGVALALGVGFAVEGRNVVDLMADSHRRILYPEPSGPPDPVTPLGR